MDEMFAFPQDSYVARKGLNVNSGFIITKGGNNRNAHQMMTG